MNGHPIVFVHGVMGWGPEEKGFGRYWGTARELQPKMVGNLLGFASVGPVSSHWDRARELFYQIKGLNVDYGRSFYGRHHLHSEPGMGKAAGIQPWDKARQGGGIPGAHFPQWNADNPIHFVGHSQGCLTILLLQYMLENQLFPDQPEKTSADWIRSVTCISGVLNGTTLHYALLGADAGDGFIPTPTRWGTKGLLAPLFGLWPPDAGNFIRLLLHPMRTWPLLWDLLLKVNWGYNWDLQQWGIERQSTFGIPEPLAAFFHRLNHHPFLYGRDSAVHSLSVHGNAQLNAQLKPCATTTYLSFPTRKTVADQHPLLRRFGHAIGSYRALDVINRPEWAPQPWWPSFATELRKWQINDGLVPWASQCFPWLGTQEQVSSQFIGPTKPWPLNPKTGTWYVMTEELQGLDHLDICMFPSDRETKERQEDFYLRLCCYLANL